MMPTCYRLLPALLQHWQQASHCQEGALPGRFIRGQGESEQAREVGVEDERGVDTSHGGEGERSEAADGRVLQRKEA